MLVRTGVCVFVVTLLGGPMPAAFAGQAPWFVVPGKPGIPVIVNPLGFDASYQVVEGDFGLDRPAQVNPVIVGGPHVLPPPYFPGRYFPMEGRSPGYGRFEAPPRRRSAESRPGQSYFRSWTAQSDPLPATIDNPNPYPLNIDVGVNGGWWGGGGWRRRPGPGPGPGPWPPGPRPGPRPGPHRR